MGKMLRLMVMVVVLGLVSSTLPGQAPIPKAYTAVLMPLNSSGVTGQVSLTLDGDKLTVHVTAAGLTAGEQYPQYIRGFVIGAHANATCPPPAADTDGDGTISLLEAVPYFGPVMKSLFVAPGVFPTAEDDGTLDYTNTFTIDPHLYNPLQSRTVSLHRRSPDGHYENEMPLACGEIRAAASGQSGR